MPRTAGGHRVYGADAVKRLNFVRRATGSVPDCPIIEALFDGEDQGVC